MIGIIIQARTSSTRLPNKVILPFYNRKCILELLLERLINHISLPVIVATSQNSSDNIIEVICNKMKVPCFRGSETNVLSRFINAAEEFKINKIIRICSDNLFIDIDSLKYQIISFKNSEYDYWAYSLNDNTPTIRTHYGFWGEGVSLNALKKIASITNEKIFLEHVTNFIYTEANLFSIYYNKIDADLEKLIDKIRLTVDTLEDFKIISELHRILVERKLDISIGNIISILNYRDDLTNIMASQIIINQK